MVIEFEETIENCIEFVLYHRENSPSMKRQLAIGRFISVAVVVLVPFILIYFIPQGIVKLMEIILRIPENVESNHLAPFLMILTITLSLAIGIYMYVQFPKINTEQTIKNLRKMYSEGENKNTFGHCMLSLSPEGILCKKEISEYKVGWLAIKQLAQTDNCIFLYTDSVNALVIPKDAFSSEQIQKKFLDYINNNINAKS